MGAVINYRRSIGSASPLIQQFLHDSRTDVIKFDGKQVLIQVGSGDPFRNQDVTVNFAARLTGMQWSFAFTSGGKADEFVSLHGVLDPNVQAQVYLNGVLIAEYFLGGGRTTHSPAVLAMTGGDFYRRGDLFASPFLLVQPSKGVNTLLFKSLPAANDDNNNIYFDGIGLNVRGGPKP